MVQTENSDGKEIVMEAPKPQGNDLDRLIDVLGEWFEGFAKFTSVINAYDSQFHVGDKLLMQRLVRHSREINLYLRQEREKVKSRHDGAQEKLPSGLGDGLPEHATPNCSPASAGQEL